VLPTGEKLEAKSRKLVLRKGKAKFTKLPRKKLSGKESHKSEPEEPSQFEITRQHSQRSIDLIR
jgi:hypothetical protein